MMDCGIAKYVHLFMLQKVPYFVNRKAKKCATSNATAVPLLKDFIVCRWLIFVTADE